MTLPDERYRAVLCTKNFLRELAFDRKRYPRLSLEVRQRAASLLKHYPTDYDMQVATERVPEVFSKKYFGIE
jgi:hypothetical protein